MLSKYNKAIIAIVGAILTAVLSISTNADVAAVNWDSAFAAVGVIITGILTYLVRNKQTVEAIDTAIEKADISVDDLKQLYEKWNSNR